jgi:WD40 repeat protein
MQSKKIVNAVFLLCISFSLLIACNGKLPATAASVSLPSSTGPAAIPVTFTPYEMPGSTATPTIPVNTTDQARRNTPIVVAGTARALQKQTEQAKATQIAQFPVPCTDQENSILISPDGQWLAAGCGYKRDQGLVVVNKAGVRWELKFKNFIHPDSFLDGLPPMGTLYPKFWSPDGVYLYFSPTLGYSGGGNQCFPTFKGNYGLFRLNVKNGNWATLIPATDIFPGYGVAFTHTGRRYATDMNGITITDLNTGGVVMLDVPATIEGLSWSPDGTRLAYTVASCGEELVDSSSVYIWDSATNQSQELFTVDGQVLRPETWLDESTLKVSGEQYVGLDTFYTVYEYDVVQRGVIFSGTVTPLP